MFFDVLTLFPNMFDGILSESILSRAIKNGLISVKTDNIRDYTTDKHNTADDEAYGGEPGMVMKPEPASAAIKAARKRHSGKNFLVIYMSPHGKVMEHETVARLAKLDGLVILCGHYKGIDQRVIDKYVDEELSLGDFVLSGGEIPAMALIDSVSRLVDGVLGNGASASRDSHYDGLLSAPCFTRPEIFEEMSVPSVLISGNHANIAKWHEDEAKRITKEKRFDLWQKYESKNK
ncbi:MAG: tRNA (guanosine(37)-N1)-methyltransferase TrmD [Chitinivibrionia bacterium]|nr:tRNA (guanosine(37)-N1)-methyltransferase TrmD [Chitinivibrionia bacterium]